MESSWFRRCLTIPESKRSYEMEQQGDWESTRLLDDRSEMSLESPNEDPNVIPNVDRSRNSLLKRENMEHGINNFQAMINMIKGLVGTGILSLPLAFYYAGIWTGLSLTLIIILINVYCMHLLVNASHRICHEQGHMSLNYAKVAEQAFLHGPKSFARFSHLASIIVDVFIVATQLGFCCVYFVFVADNFRQVIDHYLPSDPLGIHTYIAILLIPILLLSLIRHLKFIAPFSLLSNLLYFVGFVITFQYILRNLEPIEKFPAFNSWATLPLFFGMVMFAFEGVSLVLPIENRMHYPADFAGWTGVLNTSCLIVLALYCAIGFFGFLRFGDSIKDHGTITLNLPEEKLYQSVKIIFAIGVIFTYAVQFYVPIDLMREKIEKKFHGDKKKAYWVELLTRIGMVLFTFGMAELIPHVDLFISLVGSLTGAGLALIFPPIIDIVIRMGESSWGLLKWRLWTNVVIILIGLLGTVTGTYSSLKEIVETFHSNQTSN